MNELHARIGYFFKIVEDVGIENEKRNNGEFIFQGMVECCIIMEAQVSPKPDDIYKG